MTKKTTTSGRNRGQVSDGAAVFHPFADDDAALTIGGLTIENGTDRISFSGSLDLAVDQTGLAQAQTLQTAVNAIVEALAAKSDLPEKAEPEETKAAKRVRNPFA